MALLKGGNIAGIVSAGNIEFCHRRAVVGMNEAHKTSRTRGRIHRSAESGSLNVSIHIAIADNVVVRLRAVACNTAGQSAHFAVAGNLACHSNPLQRACPYHSPGNASRRCHADNIHILERQVPDSPVVQSSKKTFEGLGVPYRKTLYSMASAVQNTGKTLRIRIVHARSTNRHPLHTLRNLNVAGKIIVLRQVLTNSIQLLVSADRLRHLQRRVLRILRIHQGSPVALLLHPSVQLTIHYADTFLVFGHIRQVVEFPRVGFKVVKLYGRAVLKLLYKPGGIVIRLSRL